MSTLQTRGFSTIVGSIAAGMQGRISSQFLNFALGKVLRGLAEAYAGVCLWLQAQALSIAKLTRLATSYGSDVDSFVADFPLSGVARLPAQAATGLCIFGRYTAGPATVYVPVGGIVKTLDGTQSFQVYPDTTNPAYVASYVPLDPTLPGGGYAMLPQVATVSVPVQGITNGTTGAPGSNGNVAAGSIALIASQMPGVDTVTNPAAFTNGIDVESDASVKTRFQQAVQGRGGGTVPAIQSAVANLKVGMSCVVLENADLNGTIDPGMVTVIVDDGSGNISSTLLTAAQVAVNGVRAAGIRTGVYAATTALANVVAQIEVAAGYVRSVVVAQVVAALGLYINGLGQGIGLEYFNIPAIAKTVPGCTGIVNGSYSLNGGTSDMVGTPQTTIKTGALTIS